MRFGVASFSPPQQFGDLNRSGSRDQLLQLFRRLTEKANSHVMIEAGNCHEFWSLWGRP